jgi:hypothetical protein
MLPQPCHAFTETLWSFAIMNSLALKATRKAKG